MLPECHFYALVHNTDQFLPTSVFQYKIRLQPSISSPIALKEGDIPMSPVLNQSEQPLVPENFFSHNFCEVPLQDGETSINCLVMFPTQMPDSGKFPVIHYVYSGPCSQVVKNNWFRIAQFIKYTTAGYAVFLADSRGSSNRGIKFESPLKYNMVSLKIFR